MAATWSDDVWRLAMELWDPMPELGDPHYEAERTASHFEGNVPASAEVIDEARRRLGWRNHKQRLSEITAQQVEQLIEEFTRRLLGGDEGGWP